MITLHAPRDDAASTDETLRDTVSPARDAARDAARGAEVARSEDTDRTVPQPARATPPPAAVDPFLQELDREEAEERRSRRRALVLSVLAHVALLLAVLPELRPLRTNFSSRQGKAFVVQQLRFKPPPPERARPPKPPDPKARKIPIPDPTPDDPEPILQPELEVPDLDLPELDDPFFGVPDGIPMGEPSPGLGDVLQVGGDVQAPVKVYAPQPRYTEEARKARIEGTVILQAVIDKQGNVIKAEVVKGLPLGLSESAVETVKQWTFRPAMKNGQPVSVYFNLVVTFRLL